MFNPGLYFKTLDSTKTRVLLNLGLESFVIRAYMNVYLIVLARKIFLLFSILIQDILALRHFTDRQLTDTISNRIRGCQVRGSFLLKLTYC